MKLTLLIVALGMALAQEPPILSPPVAGTRIVKKVTPIYPVKAQNKHLQGVVQLRVIVGKDGSPRGIHVVSGHPVLVKAASKAVMQWKFQPLQLNNLPIEYQDHVTVVFKLPKSVIAKEK